MEPADLLSEQFGPPKGLKKLRVWSILKRIRNVLTKANHIASFGYQSQYV